MDKLIVSVRIVLSMEREERKSEKAYTAAAGNKKEDYTQEGRKRTEVDGSVVCHNDNDYISVRYYFSVYYRSESKRKARRIAHDELLHTALKRKALLTDVAHLYTQ